MNKNGISIMEWIQKHTLSIILVIGLIQGLVYVFSVPPWWHFDEPGHFEFAWQIAHFDHMPHWGEVDENMRRQMAASMDQYGWYETTNYRLDLSSNEPVYVGVSHQTTHPLYYFIVSLPLRLLGNADFAVQNRVARLISLVMFLLTLYITWETLGELVPKGHPLQWMVTVFIALLPGFVDTMTSINDDVGAVLAFSIFVWVSIRLIKNGPSFLGMAELFVSLMLCYWMKDTAWPAIPIGFLVILFSIFIKRWRWLPWSLVLIFMLASLLFVFRWGDAASWYLYTPQVQPSSTETVLAPLGKHAFQILAPNQYLAQWFNPVQTRSLRNKTVTLGAWMWADKPTQAYAPILVFNTTSNGNISSSTKTINLTTSPIFFSTTILVPNDTALVTLLLQPASVQGSARVYYYDGITLLVGADLVGEPQFKDASAMQGTWADRPFVNLVRNASAEASRFWINPIVSQKLFNLPPGTLPGSLDVFIASIQDWQGTGWYYHDDAQTLLQTFWGVLARNKAGLLGAPLSYNILIVITLFSLPGLLVFIWRKRKSLNWTVFFILGVDLVSIWGLVLARGGGTLYYQDPVYTWARYAFPAIIPTSLLLCVGWLEGLRLLGKLFHISRSIQYIAFLAFMFGLDIFALISMAHYFYWNQGQEYLLLFFLLPVSIFLFLILFVNRRDNTNIEN